MKNEFFLISLLLLTIQSLAQIQFEEGYIIDNEGKRINCLIKNRDWKDSPVEMSYKITADDIIKTGNVENIKEFGFDGILKFVSVKTKVDRTSEELRSLTADKNPLWLDEHIFVQVLVEGKATLYFYRNRNVERFFYSVPDSSVKQLIYKPYLTTQTTLEYNAKFRQQLWLELRNPNMTMKDYENLDYTQKDLTQYFRLLNSEKLHKNGTLNQNKNRDFLNLKVMAGLNRSVISVQHSLYGLLRSASAQSYNFNAGAEAELFLPFNKNKWSLFLSPTFQQMNSENEELIIEYNSLQVPLGLRYSVFFNKQTKIFINGIFIPRMTLDFKSAIYIKTLSFEHKFDVAHSNSFAIGTGINYKKLSFEMRYYFENDISRTTRNVWCYYERLSFSLGYSLMLKKYQ